MKKIKKLYLSILGAIFCLAMTLCFSTASAYFFNVQSGWPGKISVVSVVFTLNGRDMDTVTSYDLGLLHRGGEVDLDFEIKVRGINTSKTMTEYNLSVEFLSTDGTNAYDNELTRAIEVYLYTNGRYEYQCMLNELSEISGNMLMNGTVNRYYKLVYSETAGDYYESTDFLMHISARGSATTDNSAAEEYIDSAYEFFSASQPVTVDGVSTYPLSGKTIKLTKDIDLNDIIGSNYSQCWTNSTMTFNFKVGIDFQGHTLNIPTGYSVVIDYDDVPSSDEAVICDSDEGGGITGGGKLYRQLSERRFDFRRRRT